MTTPEFTQADIATTVAQTLNMFSTVAVDHALALVHPEGKGNPAVVVTARDGKRYGLEICPIPDSQLLPDTPMGGPEVPSQYPGVADPDHELNQIDTMDPVTGQVYPEPPTAAPEPDAGDGGAVDVDPYLCDCPDEAEYHRVECPEYEEYPEGEDEPEQGTVAADYAPGGRHNP